MNGVLDEGISTFSNFVAGDESYIEGEYLAIHYKIVDGAAVTNASSTSRTVEKTEIVLISPNGTKYKLRVADNGTISTEQVT